MSEKEKKSISAADSTVAPAPVEQSAASRHKQPFRPIDMQEDAPKELQHKRSKAPAVPSVTELKSSAHSENKGRKESERAISEKHSQNVAKKMPSVTKRRTSSPETITLAPLVVGTKKESITPIPGHVPPTATDPGLAKHAEKSKDDDEDITEDASELLPHEVAKVSSEWTQLTKQGKKLEKHYLEKVIKKRQSDEEEAGGLPRSESRSSRVSRAVRQLFCCGMPLDPPSEHKMSPRTEHDII